MPRSDHFSPLAPLATILIGVTLSFMLVLLSLRLYVRLGVTGSFGLDDCTPSLDWRTMEKAQANTTGGSLMPMFGC